MIKSAAWAAIYPALLASRGVDQNQVGFVLRKSASSLSSRAGVSRPLRARCPLVGPFGGAGLWVKVDDRHVQSGTLRRNAKMNGNRGFSCPAFLAQERHSFHCRIPALWTT
jgi:hypothetical protein